MELIVLAGGLGTRLRSVVADVPKPMAPVAGRPFLELLLKSLAGKGARRAILSVGHLSQSIVEHFGDQFAGLRIAYAVEQSPLGTGGALRAALELVEGDHALIVNGDTFLDLELDEISTLWSSQRRPILVARSLPDASRYGRLTVDGDRVEAFTEKGVAGPGLVNAGAYLFPCDIARFFPPVERFSLETDVLVPRLREIDLRCFVSSGYFIDIGVPEDFARAQTELAGVAA